MGKSSVHGERLSPVERGGNRRDIGQKNFNRESFSRKDCGRDRCRRNRLGAIALLTVSTLLTASPSTPAATFTDRAPSQSGIERGPLRQTVIGATPKQSELDNGTAADLTPPMPTDGPPELPVLEPYTFEQSVSVPPIAPLEAPAASTPVAPSVSVPPLVPPSVSPSLPSPVPSSLPSSLPTVASPPAVVEPVETIEPVEPVATVEPSEPQIPLEPPFLDNLAEQIEPTATSQNETQASDSAQFAVPAATVSPAAPPALPTPAASQTIPPIDVRPANVSRWPAPIPFGQPLPGN